MWTKVEAVFQEGKVDLVLTPRSAPWCLILLSPNSVCPFPGCTAGSAEKRAQTLRDAAARQTLARLDRRAEREEEAAP